MSTRLIDLHLHTTASDGRCTPRELVETAAAAGITVMAVSDHDTTAAVDEVRSAAQARGIAFVPGIEITAVEDGRDIHVLGYFYNPHSATLADFLASQRLSRIDRVERIAARLHELGMPIEAAAMLREARTASGQSIGRPQVARAMIAAGHATDMREAFDRWLGIDGPAFVARAGKPVAHVVAVIHAAGGLASLAHPGRTRMDDRIFGWRDAGLDAIEVYHSDHDPATVARYRRLAGDLGMLITGGSDYHADPARSVAPGTASLPAEDWVTLEQARRRHAAG